MSTRARRLLGALSMLALLALAGAALATADTNPPVTGTGTQKTGKLHKAGQGTPAASAPKNAVPMQAYRLFATLSGTDTAATGRWDGYLVHTNGVVQNGAVRPGIACRVRGTPTHPPMRPGVRPGMHSFFCQPVPPFAIPSGNHWILGWKLTYSALSSAPTGTDIRLNSPGHAGVLVTTLCTTCTVGKFGRVEITADQANALLAGNGYVVVRTTAKPDGEINGQIKRAPLPLLLKTH